MAHWGFRDGEVPAYARCPDCRQLLRVDRLDLVAEHRAARHGRPLPNLEATMLHLVKHADKTGPEPARNHPDKTGALPSDELPAGALLEPWPLDRVELVGDPPAEHNFSDSFVARALADGYLEFTNPRAASSPVPPGVSAYPRDPVITGDEIVLHLHGGPLRYTILEPPGKYPDDTEPSGWRVSHEYRCRLAKAKG